MLSSTCKAAALLHAVCSVASWGTKLNGQGVLDNQMPQILHHLYSITLLTGCENYLLESCHSAQMKQPCMISLVGNYFGSQKHAKS